MRLTVGRDGALECAAEPLVAPAAPVRLGIAAAPITIDSPFLYHKTTDRAIYDDARGSCPGCDDVVLWNPRREVTESTIANIVVELGGERVTPPMECGLLPGVFRARLLATGQVRERRITLDELRAARRVWLVNSVRRWRDAVVVDAD